jgi:hypothetical protein
MLAAYSFVQEMAATFLYIVWPCISETICSLGLASKFQSDISWCKLYGRSKDLCCQICFESTWSPTIALSGLIWSSDMIAFDTAIKNLDHRCTRWARTLSVQEIKYVFYLLVRGGHLLILIRSGFKKSHLRFYGRGFRFKLNWLNWKGGNFHSGNRTHNTSRGKHVTDHQEGKISTQIQTPIALLSSFVLIRVNFLLWSLCSLCSLGVNGQEGRM